MSGFATDVSSTNDISSTRGGNELLGDVLVVLGVFAVLGLSCGVLWWLLVDPAMFTKVDTGGSMRELELNKRFRPDGWFAVLAAVAGVAAGSLLTWWRSRDYLTTTVLVLIGAMIAGVVMVLVGGILGPEDPVTALASATIGQKVPVRLALTTKVSYLVWPTAALLGALIVLWSPTRTDPPEQ